MNLVLLLVLGRLNLRAVLKMSAISIKHPIFKFFKQVKTFKSTNPKILKSISPAVSSSSFFELLKTVTIQRRTLGLQNLNFLNFLTRNFRAKIRKLGLDFCLKSITYFYHQNRLNYTKLMLVARA